MRRNFLSSVSSIPNYKILPAVEMYDLNERNLFHAIISHFHIRTPHGVFYRVSYSGPTACRRYWRKCIYSSVTLKIIKKKLKRMQNEGH